MVFYAQKSDNSTPKSILLSLNDDSVLESSQQQLPALNLNILFAEDEIDTQNGLPPRFGAAIDVDYNIENSGVWTELPNGDKLWRLKIKCENALSINLLYDEFWLPDGAKFHIYSTDKLQLLGGFSSQNNRGTYDSPGKFTTGLLFGEEIVLELFEPINVAGFSKLSVDKIVHGYKRINLLSHIYEEYAQQEFGDSGPCQVNVNCEEGNNWQDEKKGVAMILVNGFRSCTGSIVNNTLNDGTPYFLTANHCIGSLDANGDTDASHYSFWWNYESNGCNNSSDFMPLSTSGATLVANNANSDFALFELIESPVDSGVDVYFNGWDRNTNPNQGGVGIHHPVGDFKKIATHNMTPSSVLSNTHWLVYWVATQNGHSVTEGGSSGSPLFQENSLIIGQVHGSIDQNNPNCDDPVNDETIYGRFDVSWNGNSPQRRLRDWLDPSNTNQISLDGINPNNTISLVGDDIICATSTSFYTIENATPPYSWTVSSNLEIIGSNTGSTVEIQTINNQGGIGTIQVSYNGGSLSKEILIVNEEPNINVVEDNCDEEGIDCDMTIFNHEGQFITSVEWEKISGNANFTHNQSMFSINVGGGTQSWTFYGKATATNACGTFTDYFTVTGGGIHLDNVVPFPNSSNVNFDLDFSELPSNTYYIEIYDMYSNVHYTGQSTNQEKTISTLDLPEGVYFLHLYDGTDVSIKQLIVNH